MTLFQSLIDRELGLRHPLYYDSILPRLVVSKSDSYYGILPNLSRLDYNPYPPLFACKFAEASGYEFIVALANEDGRVAVQDTLLTSKEEGEHPAFQGQQCHSNAVFDLAWMPGNMSFVTGSGDHTAKLWDIQSESFKLVRDFQNHTRSVRSVAFRPEDPAVFATGARDGRVLLWDTRVNSNVNVVNKPDNSINNCHPLNPPKTPGSSSKKQIRINDRINSITGLVFQDDFSLISCGASDGSIRVWDLRRSYSAYKKDPLPKHSIPYCGSSNRNGYSNLMLDKSKMKLFANCMDNIIYCFNLSTYNTLPEQKYTGYENGSFYIKSSLSPDCMYLISGSSDHNAYIWNVKYRDPIVKLTGHVAEVTCATWCQVGDIKIITCSDDARHKLWRVGKESYNDAEVTELCGKAHEIPSVDRSNKSWVSLDRTPRASKRKMNDASGDSARKRALLQENEYATPSRKSKRSLLETLNKSVLLGIPEEDGESSPKRICPNSWKNTPEDLPSTSNTRFSISDYKTPTKAVGTSTKSPISDQNSFNILNSPTLNLPNFVIDGKAPHLRRISPQKKNKRVDWLTKLAQEKMNGKSKTNSPKTNDNSDHKITEKCKSDKTLLHFFNVAPSMPNDKPLSDRTNTPEVGSKRKSNEPYEAVGGKRLNFQSPTDDPNESRGILNVDFDQSQRSHEKCRSNKSLLLYFNSSVDTENKV